VKILAPWLRPLDPLGPPFRCRERLGAVVGLPQDPAVAEFEDARAEVAAAVGIDELDLDDGKIAAGQGDGTAWSTKFGCATSARAATSPAPALVVNAALWDLSSAAAPGPIGRRPVESVPGVDTVAAGKDRQGHQADEEDQ
jgi:hypothetical protein